MEHIFVVVVVDDASDTIRSAFDNANERNRRMITIELEEADSGRIHS
jgi:hypothetical protein